MKVQNLVKLVALCPTGASV